ncbi:CRISPR-associated endonuclease Cas1 [Ornithinimicrobium avium]|uniref:CRISPR-associated endonuclease Cas1 n=1 Tax=Ornithinimicrobium avium TaxID=2283195 RepID=A0A345NLP7_9MICO|nr:CRISPR-associated endonuclease Cas1 [Ornithinimicrobium avium]AXH95955.1 CRISPR-associated endonuclease Cas1 [Ornithinimicrobium avium]
MAAPANPFTPDLLRTAWKGVRDGVDEREAPSPAIARFEQDLDANLELHDRELSTCEYRPRDLTQVALTESDRVRVLSVPAVRDRVVARAVLAIATPVVDPLLGPAAYAFRPGLGVSDAVQAVARLRDDGNEWAARLDVDECFPTIPVAYARRLLQAALDGQDHVLSVVDFLLDRLVVVPRKGRRHQLGLPQGCPLSPLLANLVLAEFDSDLLDQGFPVVRYADDICIPVADEQDAWEALREAHHSLRRLDMAPGAEDSQVMSFAQGFSFLGEDFGPRYPPAIEELRVAEPAAKTLYAARQGGRVRIASGRVIVEDKKSNSLVDVPQSHVGRIVCFGSMGLSAGVRAWALSNDVEVVLASRRGTYLGAMVGAGTARASRIRGQIIAAGSERAQAIATAMVEAKIRNQIVALQRFGRRAHKEQVEPAIRSMRRLLPMTSEAGTRSELMGLEGAAAAAYFPALGALVPETLRFDRRSRQPPLDVPNAALSFLYTILHGECITALHSVGLEPAFGVLHSEADDRPALSLDLMEEFRPLVVDQVVLRLCRSGALTPASARTEKNRSGIWLTKTARASILHSYETRMLSRTSGGLPGFTGTLRRHVYRQAQRLALALTDSSKTWTGISWR